MCPHWPGLNPGLWVGPGQSLRECAWILWQNLTLESSWSASQEMFRQEDGALETRSELRRELAGQQGSEEFGVGTWWRRWLGSWSCVGWGMVLIWAGRDQVPGDAPQ